MNAQGICLRAIGETGHPGRKCSEQPGRRGRAGILYAGCKDWLLKRFLSLAVVVESKFVNCGVADGPGMADIPLLIAVVGSGPETWHIRARSLELGEGKDRVVISEIVINAEVLFVVDAMVEPHRELVGARWLHRRSHEFIAIVGWGWRILEQVSGRGIEAAQRNTVPREEVRIELPVRNVRG